MAARTMSDSIADLLSKMLGTEVTVHNWPTDERHRGYVVIGIPTRGQAFSVARKVLNEFEGDPESGDDVQVRACRGSIDWFVTVVWVR